MNRADILREKYQKEYFACYRCRSEYKVPEVQDNEVYLARVNCKCGLKAIIRVKNGYVIGIDKMCI